MLFLHNSFIIYVMFSLISIINFDEQCPIIIIFISSILLNRQVADAEQLFWYISYQTKSLLVHLKQIKWNSYLKSNINVC